MDRGGQFTVDLLFATLILLITITSIVSVISSGMSTANGTEISKGKVLADDVARSIDSVYSNGYGQYSVLQLPNVSDATDGLKYNYTVTVNSSGVTVNYMGKSVTSSIMPNNNLNIASITMHPGETYNITNNQGQISFQLLS